MPPVHQPLPLACPASKSSPVRFSKTLAARSSPKHVITVHCPGVPFASRLREQIKGPGNGPGARRRHRRRNSNAPMKSYGPPNTTKLIHVKGRTRSFIYVKGHMILM